MSRFHVALQPCRRRQPISTNLALMLALIQLSKRFRKAVKLALMQIHAGRLREASIAYLTYVLLLQLLLEWLLRLLFGSGSFEGVLRGVVVVQFLHVRVATLADRTDYEALKSLKKNKDEDMLNKGKEFA